MTSRTLSLGVLCALLLPASALAQDGFPGQFELEGKYSTRKKTAVELKVTKLGSWDSYAVTRTARFTSRRYRNLPPFTWSSTSVRISGRTMRVVYSLPVDPSGADSLSIIDGLNPDTATTADALTALGQRNVIEALYFLSADGKNLREVAFNTTRLGPQRGWRYLTTEGERLRAPDPSTGGLSDAEFEASADETMREWYQEWVRESYEDDIADAATADERRELEEARDRDLDWTMIEIMGDDYDYFENALDGSETYLDAHGRAIPPSAMEAKTVSMYPEFAGIGLSKIFLFDTRTGEVIDTSDIID